jgi:excisionase family DNA binding protein
MNTDVEPLLLSATEAAEALRISRRTLFSWTADGAIVCVRRGTRVFYDPADLRKFIEAHKVTTSEGK